MESSMEYTSDGRQVKSVTDSRGNQTSVAVGSNVLEQTAYRNKNGLTDRMTFAIGEAIRNEYDSKEQMIAQYLVKADGTEEKLFTNTYDHYGNVVRHEDHRGDKVTGYQYDFIERLLGEDVSDGFRIRTAYDDKNRVKSYFYRADGKGNKTEFVYGDPAKQQKPGLGYGVLVNGEECIQYTYVQGKEKGLTTSLVESVKEGNKTLYYSYDAAGNITGLIDSTGTEVVTYSYDTWGKLLSKTDGSGNVGDCSSYCCSWCINNCKWSIGHR